MIVRCPGMGSRTLVLLLLLLPAVVLAVAAPSSSSGTGTGQIANGKSRLRDHVVWRGARAFRGLQGKFYTSGKPFGRLEAPRAEGLLFLSGVFKLVD